MAHDLPPALRAALARLAEGAARRDLARRSARITATYRARGDSAAAVDGPDDALAYALARMPATYAATAAALARVAEVLPDWAPASLTDLGAGPGTAAWAATAIFPGIARIRQIDRHAAFANLARTLAAEAPHAALSGAEAVRADLTDARMVQPPADLVIAAYALAEIPETRRDALVAAAFAAARDVLVLVEPGTPDGAERIRAARAGLIGRGAKVLAPCPHDAPCPMRAPDWCHFSQRLARSRDHMAAKGARVPFEDEKFAYLAVSRRAAPDRPGARVIAPPNVEKPAITLRLCGPGGIIDHVAPRRDPHAHRMARRLDWGDGLKHPKSKTPG